MVKLSRRGPRKSKRSYSKKSLKKRLSRRRMLKGGKYEGPDRTYKRTAGFRGMGGTLYELTIVNDATNRNKTFKLNFSVVKGGVQYLPIDMLIKKYTDTFINAFQVTDDSGKVADIIEKLFAGKIEGLKKRVLAITEPEEGNTVTLVLLEGDNTVATQDITKGSSKPMFEDFLYSLKDDINPV